MKLILIFLPLLNSLVCGSASNILAERDLYYLTVCYVLVYLSVLCHEVMRFLVTSDLVFLELGNWLALGSLTVKWEFFFDSLTFVMLVAVITVSCFVHLYSLSYMSKDPRITLFIAYLSLFTFFMVLLVTAANLLVMIVGWEGVGLCSYLLISFWYTRIQANKSAFKAILMNRIGDFAFLLGISLIFLTFRTIDFNLLSYLVTHDFATQSYVNLLGYNILAIDLISFCLFIGAVGKSAQFGLHIWLPDAMEGPTPVSALIHAATMVTAGVFLMLRCSFFFSFNSSLAGLVVFIGAATCIMAATIGLFQYDIKKVIAFSTCSQLGYMVFSIGLENYIGGIFHLFTHAFFKALLFLCAGSVIHALSDEQNMKRMGSLGKILPFTYTAMVVGSMALAGAPFFAGHFSKDFILEAAFTIYSPISLFAYTLGNLAVFFTALYSVRLLLITFVSPSNSFKSYLKTIHESSPIILFVLFILTFFSIFIGFVTKEIFIGLSSSFFDNELPVKQSFDFFDLELLPVFIKNLPTFTALCGTGVGVFCYHFWQKGMTPSYFRFYFNSLNVGGHDRHQLVNSFQRSLFGFFNQRYYFDLLYNRYVGLVFLKIGYHVTYKCLDKGFLELFGPTGVYNMLWQFSHLVRRWQNSKLSDYGLFVIGGLTAAVVLIDFYGVFFMV